MHHAPSKTIGLIGATLSRSYSEIAGEMGLKLPELVRVPVVLSVGGWEFQGTWVYHPLVRQGVWRVEGMLEREGNEPRWVHCCGVTGRAVSRLREGPFDGSSGLEEVEDVPGG